MRKCQRRIRKTILIVEDDLNASKALAIRLEAAGYDVLTARDGVQGVQRALAHQPDLILTDIWLPVGIGFSIAQRLEHVGLGNIPFIFITASRLPGLREAAMKMGAAAYFEKPYDSEALLRAVASAVFFSAGGPPVQDLKHELAA